MIVSLFPVNAIWVNSYIYAAASRFVEISKKDALLISFILAGLKLKDIASAYNKDIKQVYYDRAGF